MGKTTTYGVTYESSYMAEAIAKLRNKCAIVGSLTNDPETSVNTPLKDAVHVCIYIGILEKEITKLIKQVEAGKSEKVDKDTQL